MTPSKRDEPLRSGEVTVERGDKVYTAKYDVLRGGAVRLETGLTCHLGAFTEEQAARQLLNEIIATGYADRIGLGRVKTK